MTVDKFKEALRIVPAATACVLAISAAVLKLVRPESLEAILHGAKLEAVLLAILALIAVELTIERLDVFPRVKLIPELKRSTDAGLRDVHKRLDSLQSDMSTLSVIFARDLDRAFCGLARQRLPADRLGPTQTRGNSGRRRDELERRG